MKIWVLRHGEAEPHARSDDQRQLTDHGRKQVLKSAAHLLGQPLQAIIASPYVRAQQTAALVHQALGFDQPVATMPWLTPESDPDEVINQLNALEVQDVLLVSHQPLVGHLVGLLAQGSRQVAAPMGTASLAELDGGYPWVNGMTLLSLRHA